jgi:hypothetical protein
MAGNKKPRKKYRPKSQLVNPITYVLEGFKPVTEYSEYLADLKIKNHLSMTLLLQGKATKKDMDNLVAMSNMVEALQQMGFGTDYKDVAVEGRHALLSVIWRATEKLRFVPTGPEITALNTLMELHDAQMEIVTVGDIDKAIARAKQLIKQGMAVKLPPVPDQLREQK